jgi:hypothetical protein
MATAKAELDSGFIAVLRPAKNKIFYRPYTDFGRN